MKWIKFLKSVYCTVKNKIFGRLKAKKIAKLRSSLLALEKELGLYRDPTKKRKKVDKCDHTLP